MGSMEISNAHHHQAMGGGSSTLPLEEVLASCPQPQQQERKVVRPQPEQSLKCPRCESTNTKFCYYNNYSLSQPRYFCKGCRRYWTKGGSLRNVPVGGGCRKNKRSSSSSSPNSSSTSPSNSSNSSSRRPQDHPQTTHLMITSTSSVITPSLSTLFPPPHQLSYDPSDLTLAFARLHKQPAAAPGELGLAHLHEHDPSFLLLANPNPSPSPNPSPGCIIPPYSGPGFLDILRGGFLDTITPHPHPHPHPNGFSSLFYGWGGNNGNGLQEVEGVGGGEKEEVVVPLNGGLTGGGAAAAAAAATATATATTATTVTTSQLEPCRGLDHGGESKNILMGGLQWQLGGDGNLAVDSAGRDFWNVNGVASSSSSTSCTSWHGIINSSLM